MYEEFLTAVLAYVQALNKASNSITTDPDMTPYVQFVPVLMDGELCGFLTDEVDGAYSYMQATEAEQEWWKSRPGWKKR